MKGDVLCTDEGCPQSGTDHVCSAPKVQTLRDYLLATDNGAWLACYSEASLDAEYPRQPKGRKIHKLYVIGSLRSDRVPEVARQLRNHLNEDWEVFDDWYAAGPEADDYWKTYEQNRGRSYREALTGHAAKNVFAFDKKHLDSSDVVLLVLPAGKSGHLELGYCAGQGKRTAILLDDVDRWDVMYQFAGLVTHSVAEVATYANGR